MSALIAACTNSPSSSRQAARPRPAAPAALPSAPTAPSGIDLSLITREDIASALHAWHGTLRHVTDAQWPPAPSERGLVVVRTAITATAAWEAPSQTQTFRVTDGMFFLSDTRSIALTTEHVGHTREATTLVAMPPEHFSWTPEPLREATLGDRAACFHEFRTGRCLPGCEEALDYFRRPYFRVPLSAERSQALGDRPTGLFVDVAVNMHGATRPINDYCGNGQRFRTGDLVGYRVASERETVVDWEVVVPTPEAAVDAGSVTQTPSDAAAPSLTSSH